jgi:hypothetical protein
VVQLIEQSSVADIWWRSLLNEDVTQTNSAETLDTQEKRFELKTVAEAEWQHDCPYWMFENITPSS